MRGRILIYLVALALIIMGIGQYLARHRSPDFEAPLLTLNTQQLVRIEITPPEAEPYTLLREARRWLASRENTHLNANPTAVNQLLHAFTLLHSEVIVTASASEWENYDLRAGQATRFDLHAEDGSVESFLLGKFSMNEAGDRLETYIRLEGQQEVYAVNGLPLAALSTHFSDYRPNQLLELANPIQRLRLIYGDSMRSQWPGTDTQQSEPMDSLELERQLLVLESIEGEYFSDDMDELTADQTLFAQLLLYTQADSFRIDCYRDTTLARPFTLHSNQFPEVWLASDSAGLFRQVFGPWEDLLIPADTTAAIAPSLD